MTDQIDIVAARIAGRLKSDWQTAYEIACVVEKNKGNGGDRRSANRDQIRDRGTDQKVSGEGLARRIKTHANGTVYGFGADAILRTLKKWDRLALTYGLPVSADLTPQDAESAPPAFPDRAWMDSAGEGTAETTKAAIKKNIKAVIALIAEDRDFAAEIGQAIIEFSHADGETPRGHAGSPRDYGRLIERVVNTMSVILLAARSGEYELTSRDEALLYFVTRLLGERLAPEGDLVGWRGPSSQPTWRRSSATPTRAACGDPRGRAEPARLREEGGERLRYAVEQARSTGTQRWSSSSSWTGTGP